MAKPIKETPYLQGKDAVIFEKKFIEKTGKSESKEVLDRIRKNYELISKNAKLY